MKRTLHMAYLSQAGREAGREAALHTNTHGHCLNQTSLESPTGAPDKATHKPLFLDTTWPLCVVFLPQRRTLTTGEGRSLPQNTDTCS